MKYLLCFGLVLMSTGCAHLFENRSFIDEMDYQEESFFTPGEDFQVMSGDSGIPYRTDQEIMERTPLTGRTAEEVRESRSLRQELLRKERKLTPKQGLIYEEASEYFTSISERIYYLDLTPSERRNYLDLRNVKIDKEFTQGQNPRRGLASLEPLGLKEKEVRQGMTKQDVLESWGRPRRVEVAGNPKYENERWSFVEDGTRRYIYFEGGNVQGWKMDD
jgi:hypothetical protein